MEFKWMQDILGESYTDEVEAKVKKALGERFVPRDDFNQANEEKKRLEAVVQERDKQIGELKKVDPEKLQGEIERLQGENKAKDEQYARDLTKLRLDNAVEKACEQARARDVRAVLPYLDMEKVELAEDGKTAKGLDKQLEALRKAEETGFLFHPEDKGQFKGVKAGETFRGAADKPTSEMSYEEMAAFMEANPGATL